MNQPNKANRSHEQIRRLTAMALLTALIVVLQTVGTGFRIGPIPFSLVLVPITIGATLFGPVHGTFLGLVFGAITLWGGISGADPFTFFLWSASPFRTALLCLSKAALAGLVPGLLAKACGHKLNLGCFLAALSAPVVNTGVFAVYMLTVLRPSLVEFAGQQQFLGDAAVFLFTVMIGVNFLVELLLNAVLSAAIARIVKAVGQKKE